MPILTLLLVLATLGAYSLELALGGLPVCEAFGLVPAEYSRTGNMAPIFTALFLHDPATVYHVAGNMTALLLFGAVVERDLGSLAFAATYGLAGLAGGLLYVLVDPGSTSPLVGASGAVFGVMGLSGALRPRLLGFVLVMGIWEIGRSITGSTPGVSAACHLGGLAAGVAAAMALRTVGLLDVAEAA